ncbi:hypothetical protein MY3957_010094 [Beauveria namnaoensis]
MVIAPLAQSPVFAPLAFFKKSLYQRYQDSKRGEPISDADLLKYAGKTRDEFDSWKDTQPCNIPQANRMSSPRTTASAVDSSSSSPTATRVSLTTPFVPPSGCEGGQFTTITGVPYHTTDTFVVSDPRRSSTCQPEGWDAGTPQFAYSPAVCPRRWTAYSLTVASVGDEFESHAICCSESFTYTNYVLNPLHSAQESACVHEYQTDGGNVVSIHEPWYISWKEADASSLSPTPPSMKQSCHNVQISTWVPGSKVEASAKAACQGPNEIEHGLDLGAGAFYVWLPILIVALAFPSNFNTNKMIAEIALTITAAGLAVANPLLGARSCGEGTQKICYGVDGGDSQDLKPEDIKYVAEYLRYIGEQASGAGKFWTMPKGFDCPEWGLPVDGAGTDIANAIDKANTNVGSCGKNGDQIGVVPNLSNPLYNTDEYKKSGNHPDGIVLKLVKAPKST